MGKYIKPTVLLCYGLIEHVNDETRTEEDANVTNAVNCNKLTFATQNFTSLPVKRNVSQQLCSTRHRWQTRIFLENSCRIQARDCSLCIVAHLINVSNVIEGCRKAPGEVISLSSEKHQAAGIILEEFIRHQR